MSSSTTRISDLPENITLQMPNNTFSNNGQGGGQGQAAFENTYVPMNVHPNPYGPQPQLGAMPNPQAIQRPAQQLTYEQQMMIQSTPQHRLPSRDIPMDQMGHLQDEQIQANYIPQPKLTADYINDYADTSEEIIREHERKKKRVSLVDTIFNELQGPMFIAILFFIFQMPIINTMIFKRFAFLAIYKEDGNMNFSGLFLKSALFGLVYYGASRTMTFLSEI